ncbi:hypothetical protein NDU88_006500 [Pleurodeles waltl]|uniref:Uncharacterized protein n=1 Tax=Pleurodeles waltl TaxID=8319 RepID=A0AAV7N2J8_PLEWA|nr:hypothetical protein NDU88_006500 [Pleurodeles waltl]
MHLSTEGARGRSAARAGPRVLGRHSRQVEAAARAGLDCGPGVWRLARRQREYGGALGGGWASLGRRACGGASPVSPAPEWRDGWACMLGPAGGDSAEDGERAKTPWSSCVRLWRGRSGPWRPVDGAGGPWWPLSGVESSCLWEWPYGVSCRGEADGCW